MTHLRISKPVTLSDGRTITFPVLVAPAAASVGPALTVRPRDELRNHWTGRIVRVSDVLDEGSL